MVANLLVEIEGIDKTKSSLEYFEGEHIMGIDLLVLNHERLGNHSLFRLSEFPPIVIVREEVADAFEKNGCTGIAFVAVEEFKA